jgi:hypothetical protein
MKQMHGWIAAWLLAGLLAMALGAPAGAQDAPLFPPGDAAVTAITVTAEGLTWTPQVSYAYSSVTVTVADPTGKVQRYQFPAGQTPFLSLRTAGGAPLANGIYTYEVLVMPVVGAEAQAALMAASESRDDSLIAKLQASGQLPAGPYTQAGTFSVVNGVVASGATDAIVAADAASMEPGNQLRAGDAPLDNVIGDDLIVIGSICSGFSCGNNEVFGTESLLLKQSNTRILFNDASTAGFPANDWRIVANDDTGGGANYFAIEDVTAARQIFRLSAGAPLNSFFMDGSGRIGVGTSTPAQLVHVARGDTPVLRLEQNGSSGFTAYTWDIGGNEGNFFVRDVTGGNTLPLRIRPGAPSNALDIRSTTGNVGIGTAAAAASLHVFRSNGTAQLLVEEASTTAAPRDLIKLVNASGNALMRFVRSNSVGSDWRIGSRGANFSIDDSADGLAEFFVAANGNITILGTMTTGGPTCGAGCLQRADIQVRSADVLAKLDAVPLLRWATTAAAENNPDAGEVPVTHLSPDLTSFHEVYGLGVDGQSVAPLDVASVALASAQALKATVDAQNATITAQNVQIEQMAAQMASMQATIQRLEAMAHTHAYLPAVIK